MIKNMLAAALAGLLLVSGGAFAQDKALVAVSIPAADHGWTAGVVYHAKAAAEEINEKFDGVEVIVKTSPSASAQVSALADLSAVRDMDALVILPYTSQQLTLPVSRVKAGGTFVTVVDRGLTDPTISDIYVAGDNVAVGKNTAEWLVDALDGKGKVVILRGIPTVIDNERIDGFMAGIEGSDIKVLDMQYANWNRDEAFTVMQDFLAKYKDIDAVWANDDDMLIGVLAAIKHSGRTDIQYALGANGMKEIVKKVIDGDSMTPISTAYPPSMIKTAIYMTVAHLVANAPVRGVTKLDAPLITQENAEEFYFPDSPY